MSEHPLDLSRGMLPALKVVGICTFVFAVAWWARGLTLTVEMTATEVSAIRKTLDLTQAGHSERLGSIDWKIREMDRQLALLQDYTEGRISHLPYRLPGHRPGQGD